jgi:hypothetical protein
VGSPDWRVSLSAVLRVRTIPTLRTSDKELSPLTAHRVELELSYGWHIDAGAAELRGVWLAAPSWFLYDDFPFLSVIRAFEATFAMELKL